MALDTELWGNSLMRWIVAVAIALGVLVIARTVKAVARSRLRSGGTRQARAVVAEMLDATRWFSYLALALYAASHVVVIRSDVTSAIRVGSLCVLLLQIGIWAQVALRRGLGVWRGRHGDTAHARTVAVAIGFVARLVVWSVILLTVLANLGVQVTALVAGLGIGGVAAALAIQSLLSDVFASFSMYFDRPFDIGDTIVVDDTEGTVERIGWRSTRLRANQGEEVILANGELIKRQIRNLSHVKRRHFEFPIHLEYATAELAARVPAIVEQAIAEVEGAHFEHAHLKKLGKHALVYEIEFSVEGSDQRVHKDRCQAVNLELLERFAENGIRFAAAARRSAEQSAERSHGSQGLEVGIARQVGEERPAVRRRH